MMAECTSQDPVLIVDDERPILLDLQMQLEDEGYVALTAQSAEEALRLLSQQRVAAVVTDLRMPTRDGLSLLREVKARWPDLDVVIMTAYGGVEAAVQAMQEGAQDFIIKPFSHLQLSLKLARLMQRRRDLDELHQLRERLRSEPSYHGIVGVSSGMRRVFEIVEMAAPSEHAVLVTGETGTGKELVARALHAASPRRDGPFVKVSCAALSSSLLESELFGHEEGAFTGAVRLRRGRFELADGGAIFLDDVDDFPVELQGKVLHAIEEKCFERIGGEDTLQVDVRVIAATKADLHESVARGVFREDLYYRLNVIAIDLPPLRDRKEDIPTLVSHFLSRSAQSRGWPTVEISSAALQRFREYSWPGNVRELQNCLDQVVALLRDPSIGEPDLPGALLGPARPSGPADLNLSGHERLDWPAVLSELESQLFDWALHKAGGNQARAAALLNLPRTTFRDRLAKVGPR